MLVETLYYQNASRIGGTALATYPLFRLRAGIVRNRLDYTFASNASTAAAFDIEVLPPSSRFTVAQSYCDIAVNQRLSNEVTQLPPLRPPEDLGKR